MIKVIIADDHPVVQAGLASIIRDMKDIQLVHTCSNGEELLANLEKSRELPDVVLLDIQMPGRRGVDIARIISEKYPAIGILALTNLTETFHVEDMLQNGAKGYLLKTASPVILQKAIRSVAVHDQFIDPDLKDQILQDMLEARNRAATLPQLTKREKEILQLIAESLTSQQIAERLFLSYRTVENHRFNLLLKFDVKNTAGMIRKAIDLGLVQ